MASVADELAVGTRVRILIDEFPMIFFGQTGTITRVDDNDYPYEVTLDDGGFLCFAWDEFEVARG